MKDDRSSFPVAGVMLLIIVSWIPGFILGFVIHHFWFSLSAGWEMWDGAFNWFDNWRKT